MGISVSPEDASNHYLVPLSGLHILQGMASCDLQGDGSKEGFLQLTDGWEIRDTYRMHRYDLENCMKLLETCLSYGKEALLRRGEYLGPDWTFLLYDQISWIGLAPLGPLSRVGCRL